MAVARVNVCAGASASSGKFASLRGIPAVPAMAERIGLDRDLGLIEMTGARYHADQITTARALPALVRAKKNGLDVTAGTSIHHLTLNEIDVGDYRTFFKLTPPLRSEEDRLAMVDAVATGLIDVISSYHTPADEESKRLPFEEAASGAVGLQTLLPAAMRLYHSGEVTLPQLWRAMSLNPELTIKPLLLVAICFALCIVPLALTRRIHPQPRSSSTVGSGSHEDQRRRPAARGGRGRARHRLRLRRHGHQHRKHRRLFPAHPSPPPPVAGKWAHRPAKSPILTRF